MVVQLPTDLVARCRAVDRELVGSALVDTPAHLDQLTDSIAREGIKVPLALGYNDHFAALDGNHRIAAALRLGLRSVPVTLTRLPDQPRPRHAQDLSAPDLETIISAAARRTCRGTAAPCGS